MSMSSRNNMPANHFSDVVLLAFVQCINEKAQTWSSRALDNVGEETLQARALSTPAHYLF